MPRQLRAAVLELTFLTVLTRGLRPLIGVIRTRQALSWWAKIPSATHSTETAQLETARRAHRILLKTKRIDSTCLFRSLALWAMLRRHGILTELKVGYRRADGRIEGHVWVEFAGAPINEDLAVVTTYTSAQSPFAGTC